MIYWVGVLSVDGGGGGSNINKPWSREQYILVGNQ